MSFVGTAAHASGECGAEVAGQDAITCAAGDYSDGISYTGSDGPTVTVDNDTITVGGSGVYGGGAGRGDVVLELGGGTVSSIDHASTTVLRAFLWRSEKR